MAVTAIHPGEHLAEELTELGMSAAEFARKLEVPTNRITGILNQGGSEWWDSAGQTFVLTSGPAGGQCEIGL